MPVEESEEWAKRHWLNKSGSGGDGVGPDAGASTPGWPALSSTVAVPERIPIQREPGYRTDTIGRHSTGLFFASACSLPSNLPSDDPHDDSTRRCYDYLHTFAVDGRHIGSDIRFTGFGRRAGSAIDELLGTLAGIEFGDIAIRPFQVDYDGYVFGLVDESAPDRGPWFELYPDCLGFGPPFDGGYDT